MSEKGFSQNEYVTAWLYGLAVDSCDTCKAHGFI